MINFKNYIAAQAEEALKLAAVAEDISTKENVQIAVAPPFPALFYVAKNVKIPVFAQHSEAVVEEASTGHIPIFILSSNNIRGSIINHSERRMNIEDIARAIKMLRKDRLVSLVCARDVEEAKKIASLAPDMIAVEPPELIGTGRAVSKVSPELVSSAVKAVRGIDKNIAVLCGAGISSEEDVKAAMNLGSDGVLVASAIVKSHDKHEIIHAMANMLNRP